MLLIFLPTLTTPGAGQELSPLGLFVSGPREMLVDSPAALRIVVTDHQARRPAAGAAVSARLVQPENKIDARLFSVRANAQGFVETQFRVPALAPGMYDLIVQAHYANWQEEMRQRVTLRRAQQILLTTDKPLYKPGQIIHVRALALRLPSRQALAQEPLTFEVFDPRGNKVFKQRTQTNDFGVAFAQFQLGDEINLGEYRIVALVEEERIEKSVTVKRYVLPKFKVVLTPDKPYYLPGELVRGTVQCDYFFGKPVSAGRVKLTVKTFDIAFREIANLTGTTDAKGAWKFELRLPTQFVGQPLEQGKALLQFEAEVTDQAEHTERAVVSSRVAAAPLEIHAVPESGVLVPGVENILYVLVARPTGEPVAKARIRYSAGEKSAVKVQLLSPQNIVTDELGIAELRVKPEAASEATAARGGPGGLARRRLPFMAPVPGLWEEDSPGQQMWTIKLAAAAPDGARAETSLDVPVSVASADTALLLRTDKALARVGDVIEATAYTPGQRGTVFFDVIKDRQTMLTLAADLDRGQARVRLPLTPDLGGTIWLSAYRLTPRGETIRATRPLLVDPARDLRLAIRPDQETYRPGPDNVASLQFKVTDGRGRPVVAALGVSIVDESLFALQEMQPGLEKIYFYLEQELAKPRYEIHGVAWPTLLARPEEALPGALERDLQKQQAARVMLASVSPPKLSLFSEDTYRTRLEEAKKKWLEQLQPKAQKIQRAIEEYNQQRGEKQRLRPQEGLAPLVQAKLLSPEDLVDLWGTPFAIRPLDPHSPVLWGVLLWTWGPDKQKDTEDDMFISTVWSGMFFESLEEAQRARMPLPMAVGADAVLKGAEPEAARRDGLGGAAPAAAAEPVRIRQFFPETLFVEPALITDQRGQATLKVPMADSITSWRITTLANSAQGALGSATGQLRCFQDFFIDIDLPVALTQGDRVSIPVAVYNYLPQAQKVRLELSKADWFELTGAASHELEIAPNDVDVRYFTITAQKLGAGKILVHGYGSRMSDAIERVVEVEPNGKLMEESKSGRLKAGEAVTQELEIPAEAIADASNILVKIYPGIFSQIVEGLDSILRMPFGCFEQTSSATYPNVLVLDYMKSINRLSPEIRMKAESFINTGYQRLVSFEVPGGGFSWFGDPPANKILTAFGLMEFYDMSRVHEVDPQLIERTQRWLLAQQQPEGFWQPDEQYLHQEAWARIQNSQLPPTAYINWALAYSGCKEEGVKKADAWLRQHAAEAQDPYVLAMLCNALVQGDLVLGPGETTSVTNQALERLIGLAKRDKGQMWWETEMTGITHSSGRHADLEATGMAALALIAAGRAEEAAEVLNYLIAQKDPNGTWHSTQATTLALRALTAAQKGATERIQAHVRVEVNGQLLEAFELTPENADVLRQIDARRAVKPGKNVVRLSFEGQGSSLYQIVSKYYVPWERVKPEEKEALDIQLTYDRTTLSKDDIVTADVTITNKLPATTSMIIVDLGLPPGFEVLAEDLENLVEKGLLQRYTLTGRQIICYIEKLTPQQTLKFSYRLRAKYPIRAQTPKSRVYEYYNTDRRAEAPPVELVVR